MSDQQQQKRNVEWRRKWYDDDDMRFFCLHFLLENQYIYKNTRAYMKNRNKIKKRKKKE